MNSDSEMGFPSSVVAVKPGAGLPVPAVLNWNTSRQISAKTIKPAANIQMRRFIRVEDSRCFRPEFPAGAG